MSHQRHAGAAFCVQKEPRGRVLRRLCAQRQSRSGDWAGGRTTQKGWSRDRVQRCPIHPGPACWNFCRTDLAKLLIFYKDLNQRSIVESPANTVSSFVPGPVLGLRMPISLASGAGQNTGV